jgi:pyruvate/oxaloacetate carboxyltransferase
MGPIFQHLLSLGLVNVLAGRYFHDIADEFKAECGVVVHRTPCPFSSEVEAHFLSLD